jgi:hypothetical protein
MLLLAHAFSSETGLAEEPPTPLKLAWSAPAQCPTDQAVLGEMQRILGGPPSRAASAKADVEQLGPQRWREHLTTEVESVVGERTLDADSCDGLVAATALILAWTIDPQRAAIAGAAAASSQPEAQRPTLTGVAAVQPALPAVLGSARPSTPPASSPSRNRTQWVAHGVIAVDAVTDLGTLPAVGLGGRVTLGALVGPIRFEGGFADWLSQNATAQPPFSAQGAALHPLEGALRGCFRWILSRRFELDPCLGGGLTYVTSNGFRETIKTFTGETAKATTWGSVYGDALGVVTLAGPFALRGTLGFAVPLARPEFDIQEQGTSSTPLSLSKASVISGRASLGIEAHFP